MKIERFTDKARQALHDASVLAQEHNHRAIYIEHLLDALLKQEGGVVQQIIQKANGDMLAAQYLVEQGIDCLPHVYGASEPGISSRLRSMLEKAWEEMNNLKDGNLSIEHMLLAMLDCGGTAQQALKLMGLNRDQVLKVSTSTTEARHVVERYGYPVIEAAKQNITTITNEPLKLFYCYAHEDRALRDELDAHLSGMKRQKLVQVWYDREIRAGQEWENEIDKNLATSHIILLLISARFLASDYCYGIEMQKALQRHEAGTARVVPILLRPVDWEDAPFSKLQILPTEAKPVTRWTDPNDAFEDIAKELRKVVKDLHITLKTKEAWLDEGIALHNLKQYEEAIIAFDQALKLDPSYVSAYHNKGCTLDDLERYEEAIIAYDQAIRFNPSFAEAYCNKGIVFGKIGQYEKAITVFEQAIRLQPTDVKAHYNKAIVFQHMHRNFEAQAAFAKAKELGY